MAIEIVDLPTKTIHAGKNPQYKMHMGVVGWCNNVHVSFHTDVMLR
jgi:hypothetical protein